MILFMICIGFNVVEKFSQHYFYGFLLLLISMVFTVTYFPFYIVMGNQINYTLHSLWLIWVSLQYE